MTTYPKDKLSVAATDLTLFFGAESYIRRCAGDTLSDPEGRICLQTLVDLVLNCDKLYLTLPGPHPGNPSELLPVFRSYFHMLPESSLDLKEEVERDVQAGFSRFLVSKGFHWTRDWVNFQFRSPIVTSGHSLRLGNRMISDAGWSMWKDLRVSEDVSPLLKWPPLIRQEDIRGELSGQQGDLTAHEFALCYTFDLYRRGWQYLERVRGTNDDAAYVPHIMRLNALDSGAGNWASISYRQGTLWSWGAYICEIMHDDAYPALRSPTAVAGLVGKIRDAMVTTGCPTWDEYKIFDRAGMVIDPSDLRGLQDWVVDTARTADLPLLKGVAGPLQETTGVVVKEAVGKVIEASEDAIGGRIVFPLKLVKIVAGVLDPESVAKVDTQAEKVRRRVSSKFFKAAYEYRGLIPQNRSTGKQSGPTIG